MTDFSLPFLPASIDTNVAPSLSKGLNIINSMRIKNYVECSVDGFSFTNEGIDYLFANHIEWIEPLLSCSAKGVFKEQLQKRTGKMFETTMDRIFNENGLIYTGLRELGFNYSVFNETQKSMPPSKSPMPRRPDV